MITPKGAHYGWPPEPRHEARQAPEDQQEGQEVSYDRAARRVADNAHGNTPTGDYRDGDDVANAVYPDPKARHLYGETETLQGKRATRAVDDNVNAVEPVAKPVKAKAKP